MLRRCVIGEALTEKKVEFKKNLKTGTNQGDEYIFKKLNLNVC